RSPQHRPREGDPSSAAVAVITVEDGLAGGGKAIRTLGPLRRGSDFFPRIRRAGGRLRWSPRASSSGGDRGFESPFLQRGVWCEPDFRGRIPSMTVGDFANANPSAALARGTERQRITPDQRADNCEPIIPSRTRFPLRGPL